MSKAAWYSTIAWSQSPAAKNALPALACACPCFSCAESAYAGAIATRPSSTSRNAKETRRLVIDHLSSFQLLHILRRLAVLRRWYRGPGLFDGLCAGGRVGSAAIGNSRCRV